jgi:glycosyltransferase involved in cell wall biosynthesis
MRILHAIHDFLPRHRAGSEIYTHHLCRAEAARGLQTHVLCAEYDLARPHGSLVWRYHDELPVTELINNWAFRSFEESYRSPSIGAQLEHVLLAIQPDVLHLHNLLNLSLELPLIAARHGVPTVATLHEYTLVCPAGGQRLSLDDGRACAEITPSRCARCFPLSPFAAQITAARSGAAAAPLIRWLRRRAPRLLALIGGAAQTHAPRLAIAEEEIARRLDAVRRVYDAVALFVAPSPSLAADMLRFGLPPAKLRVSDYGFVAPARRPRRSRGARLVVGYVGTLVPHKGAHVLIEAARRLPPDAFELLIFGDPSTFPPYTSSLREAARGLPVRFMGGFTDDSAAIYARLDVLVVPSLWPENSPLVIHEAFQAGIPVVGARVGGVVDLVRHGDSGLLYDAGSSAALAAALHAVIDDPALLARLAAGSPRVKPIDDDAAEWEKIYRQVLDRP